MSRGNRSVCKPFIVQSLLAAALVLVSGGVLAADDDAVREEAPQELQVLVEPLVPEAAAPGGCSGSCTTWDDCIELGCTGTGRCDAGGCLPDSALTSTPFALAIDGLQAAAGECETFEDCQGICPGDGSWGS